MIVEREEEIEAFVAREYWSIEAEVAHPTQAFTAKLTKLDGKKFEQFTVTDGDTAEAARQRILKAAGGALHVTDVASKERKRRPRRPSPPPRCSRKPRASSASPPSAPCRSRRSCTKAWRSARKARSA
jgi:hypothetical protein